MTSDGSTFNELGVLGSTSYSSSFSVGSSFTTGGEFSLASSGPSFNAILPDGSDGPTVTTATFDRTAAISLLVGMGSTVEQTSINSLSIEGPSIGSTAVPEPSSLALFGIGACVAGIGACRRRRREKQQQPMA
jgi:hypothetical protein